MSQRVDIKTIAAALGVSERAVQVRAKKEGWSVLDRAGLGGGRRYDSRALPRPVRDALARQALRSGAAPELPMAGEGAFKAPVKSPVKGASTALDERRPSDPRELKAWQRTCMEARLALLAEVERLGLQVGLMRAREAVASAASAGELPPALQRLVPAANQRGGKSGARSLTVASLRRWEAAKAAGGNLALAPLPGTPERVLPPEWFVAFMSLYATPTKRSAPQCLKDLRKARPDLAVPPLRTVQREVAKLGAIARNRGRMGPRQLKTLQAFVRRDTSDLWPGAVFTADGHSFDARVAHPIHGRPFRPEITTILDVYTRRVVGWSVALSENTWAVLDALRHAVTTTTNPLIWYVDRGSGYNNARMQVQDEEAQGWLEAFWTDPINRLDLKLPRKLRELAIYGEQCWPAFVNEANGRVRLGYLDPGQIATVVTDPDNPEQPIGVITRSEVGKRPKRYQVIVNGSEQDCFTERTREIRAGFADGPCFYFAVNGLSNQARGTSDLLAVADWLDAYDQALFGELDRWHALRAYIWDVTLKGATPEEVNQRAGTIHPPRPGSTRVHNDAEEWQAVTPSLAAEDGAGFARLFRNHVLGARGLPEHWYGGGGDVNRATAGEMGEPVFKLLSMRQQIVGAILEDLGTYQVRQRVLAILGREPADIDPEAYAVSAVWPEMTARDTSKYAAALQQIVAGAALAVERGLMTEATAIALIASVAGRLGVEFDPAAELESARSEAQGRRDQDAFARVPLDPE